jgi:predicted enzyme related to lactoylglutathione lyase
MFKTVLTPVHDLDTVRPVWTALLGEPTNDDSYYVGWSLDGQEVGLVPNGHQQGLVGPTPYWQVDDIQAVSKALVAAGGTERQAPQDVGGGRLVALVADAEDNLFGLMQDPS